MKPVIVKNVSTPVGDAKTGWYTSLFIYCSIIGKFPIDAIEKNVACPVIIQIIDNDLKLSGNGKLMRLGLQPKDH